ncbi:MAG: GIY-YIG nuclease family protein [Alphaproteobacteria bacterium]|nr:GIY-YIG nuclease family protein [Alphaproteobacteria bacterium]
MSKSYWVYIVTDKPFGTLYTGVTSDIVRRAYEHRNGAVDGFSKRYGLKIIVWCEEFSTAIEAIEAEKRIKKWRRDWKIDLIKKTNPKWDDLYDNMNG